MENNSRYLAEQNCSDMIYSAARPFIGYASLFFTGFREDGFREDPSAPLRTKSDFTIGHALFDTARKDAENIGGLIQESQAAKENWEMTLDIFDVRDYRLHVVTGVFRHDVSSLGSSHGEVLRIDRTRVRTADDVHAVLRANRKIGSELVESLGAPPELTFHELGKMPVFEKVGVFFTYGAAVCAGVVR